MEQINRQWNIYSCICSQNKKTSLALVFPLIEKQSYMIVAI